MAWSPVWHPHRITSTYMRICYFVEYSDVYGSSCGWYHELNVLGSNLLLYHWIWQESSRLLCHLLLQVKWLRITRNNMIPYKQRWIIWTAYLIYSLKSYCSIMALMNWWIVCFCSSWFLRAMMIRTWMLMMWLMFSLGVEVRTIMLSDQSQYV